jgi:hypothetical protein
MAEVAEVKRAGGLDSEVGCSRPLPLLVSSFLVYFAQCATSLSTELVRQMYWSGQFTSAAMKGSLLDIL